MLSLRRFLLLPLLVALSPALAAGQSAWELTPLGDVRHEEPFHLMTPPVIGNGGTAYWNQRIDPETGGHELHAAPGGLLASDSRQTVEEGDFPLFGAPADAGGGSLLLLGTYFHDLPPPDGFAQTSAVYQFPGLTRIASFLDSYPGFTSNEKLQITGMPAFDGSGGVVFTIRQLTVFPDYRSALVRASGGMTILAESGVTLVPGAGGATFDLIARSTASEGVILFYGEGGGRRGVYQWSGGVLSTVVDNQTVLPPNASPVSILQDTDVDFANQGQDIAFVLRSFGGGVWKRIDGVWSRAVAHNDPIPGGQGKFFDLGAPAIRDGVLAFWGGRDNQFSPPKQAGLYTDRGGPLHPIVNLEADFGGDVPTRIDVIRGRWFDGTEAVFAAEGDAFRTVYRATPVPEPTGAAAAALAALATLARRRI